MVTIQLSADPNWSPIESEQTDRTSLNRLPLKDRVHMNALEGSQCVHENMRFPLQSLGET
jgi:hypothetical protein